MQCQICHKKTATIHLTEIIDGQRAEIHFCETCAVQHGVAAKNQISVNELLSNLLASQPSDDELFGPSELQTMCPSCGITLRDFRREGVLGCPQDYEVFADTLAVLIERAHGGKTRHCGKIPSFLPQDAQRRIQQARLKDQLQAAVQREDYELAAELRDRIDRMEKGGPRD